MYKDVNNLLLVLKAFEEYSDKNHVLSIQGIKRIVRERYGRDLDRRTITYCIKTLKDFGYKVHRLEIFNGGFYLERECFSTEEVHILTLAAIFSNNMSQRQTEEILNKLPRLLNPFDVPNYSIPFLFNHDKKELPLYVTSNIKKIEYAIVYGKSITFTYLEYCFDKKHRLRLNGPYEVIPNKIIYYMKKRFLIATQQNGKNKLLNIDRMFQIISPYELPPYFHSAKVGDTKRMLESFNEKINIVEAKLLCDDVMLPFVIQEFKDDVSMMPNDDGSFFAHISAEEQTIVLFALRHIQNVELITPIETRNRIKAVLQNNMYGIEL